MEKSLKAGGTEPTPASDEGFMQLRNLEDLDGHHWGIICLDIAKFKEMRGR
jgi:predicted lactoylglutathione lyase